MKRSPGRVRQPVIVIGMHRSGTSFVARTLGSFGLFLGWKLAANHEASFFNRLNHWLISSSGGRWDTPRSIDYLFNDTAGRDLAVEYLKYRATGLACFEYLGPVRFLRWQSLKQIGEPWGWKDPRTTITLPLWLDLFPDAKVVHVIRNGIDVADSLYRRQKVGFEIGKERLRHFKPPYQLIGKQGWFGTSPRVIQHEEGFRLWEEYLEYAHRFAGFLEDRLLEVKFESILANPRGVLIELANFCELQPSGQVLEQAVSTVRPDRSLSFLNDEALLKRWKAVRHSYWMQLYGYDQIPL